MAAIPGTRFDITGASGSQGLLTPKSGWRAYVFVRGGFASQDSAGTTITFDSSGIAGRFAAGNWIQAGTTVANIRQVAAVGGNSLTVSGAALTVSENTRIFLIGSTEPTVSGGSVTYSTPSTTIRQRDDDGSDLYTNSMITSDSNGSVAFYSLPAVYDIIVQDGNRAIQGSLIDVPVGLAEGVSTTQASVFGATVTINANLGVTGSVTISGSSSNLTVANNLTAGGDLSITGIATIAGSGGGLSDIQGRVRFGSTATFSTNAGITGTLTVGATSTFSGKASFGNSVSIDGSLGVTGTITGVSANFSGYVDFSRLAAIRGTTLASTDYSLDSGWGATASINVANTSDKSRDTRGFVSVLAGGSGVTDNPILYVNFKDGLFAGSIAYAFANRMDTVAPTTAWWLPMTVGTTQAKFKFVGLPVSGSIYTLAWLVVG